MSDRASNLGIGFAVPINAVLELLPQLQGGKVTRGRIGVNITAVQREAVELFGLPNTQGAVVASVEPDGPAALGGLEPGDVIVEYNGDLVTDTSDLQSRVTRTAPGTEVPITVMREQERTTLEVTIGELDLEAEAQPRSASNNNEDQSTGFGMTLSDLNGELSRRLGVPSDITGAIIRELEPRGAAAQAGMLQGDIIVEVNRVEVDSARSAVRELQLVDSGEPAFFLIWRDGTETFVQATKE